MGYEAYQNVLLSAVQELRNEMFTDLYKNDQDIDTGEKYVLDTSVDSDLELFFPPDYVPNDSERILLYKEMDSMEEDEQIEPFRARLIDRFGQIPWEAEELIRIVLLRHRAKKLGIERITLKVGKMILHLMKDQESTYYQSEAFDKLLRYVSTQYRYVQLREINGKRSVAISGMDTVVKAVAVLDDILNITL
jgi:transcription-repair coupling factor (superfamily II helicase)